MDKAFNSQSPSYLKELLVPYYQTWTLWSQNAGLHCILMCFIKMSCNCKTAADCVISFDSAPASAPLHTFLLHWHFIMNTTSLDLIETLLFSCSGFVFWTKKCYSLLIKLPLLYIVSCGSVCSFISLYELGIRLLNTKNKIPNRLF